jgi:hypothetical protein
MLPPAVPPAGPAVPQPPAAPLPPAAPPEPPLSHSPYDFILSPPKPKKSVPIKGGPKLLYIAAGGIALVAILFVVMLVSGRKNTNPIFTSIAQQQTEIARVANEDYSDLSDLATRDFALNTQLTMLSAQHDYLAYLAKYNYNVESSELSATQSSQTDTALSNAKANGNLDPSFKQILQAELTKYQQTLNDAAKQSGGPTRTKLRQLYDQASLLLQQSSQDDA